VILIVANIVLGLFNQVSPPCLNAEEYFSKGKKLPDGALSSLGSIPTHNQFTYVGAKRVAAQGAIGLTSWANDMAGEKNGYIGFSKKEELTNPYIVGLDQDDPSDAAEFADQKISEKASSAIDSMFKLKTEQKIDKSNQLAVLANKKSNTVGEYENGPDDMEYRNKTKQELLGRGMTLAHSTARDGYSDRRGDSI